MIEHERRLQDLMDFVKGKQISGLLADDGTDGLDLVFDDGSQVEFYTMPIDTDKKENSKFVWCCVTKDELDQGKNKRLE